MAQVITHRPAFCFTITKDLFFIPARFHIETWQFVPRCLKSVFGVSITQALDVTVLRRCFNVEFTYSLIVMIFVLAYR